MFWSLISPLSLRRSLNSLKRFLQRSLISLISLKRSFVSFLSLERSRKRSFKRGPKGVITFRKHKSIHLLVVSTAGISDGISKKGFRIPDYALPITFGAVFSCRTIDTIYCCTVRPKCRTGTQRIFVTDGGGPFRSCTSAQTQPDPSPSPSPQAFGRFEVDRGGRAAPQGVLVAFLHITRAAERPASINRTDMYVTKFVASPSCT